MSKTGESAPYLAHEVVAAQAAAEMAAFLVSPDQPRASAEWVVLQPVAPPAPAKDSYIPAEIYVPLKRCPRVVNICEWNDDFATFPIGGPAGDAIAFDAAKAGYDTGKGQDVAGQFAAFQDEFGTLLDVYEVLSLQGDKLVDEALATFPVGSVVFDLDVEVNKVNKVTSVVDLQKCGEAVVPDLTSSVDTIASDASVGVHTPKVTRAHVLGHAKEHQCIAINDVDTDAAVYDGIVTGSPRLLAIRRAMRSKSLVGGFFARSFDSLGPVRDAENIYIRPTMRGINIDRIRF